MPHAELVEDVRVGGREVRDGVVREDQPLEHRLVDEAADDLLVGAQRLEPRLADRRREQVGVDGVEVDDAALPVGLAAERHDDEAQRRLGDELIGLGRHGRSVERRLHAGRRSRARPATTLRAVRRLPEPPLGLIVFTVGFSILGAEIAAARLLAPYFGASTIVWANTIGIVLVALSVGYWYGGKLADRNPTRAGLYRIVLLSGLLLAAVPFVADPFLGVAVDALDSISAGAFVGSLLGVTALIAVPILVSGAVAPYALRLAVADVAEAGTVSGRLYAISTVGSLLGTFTSALLFIPLIGTRRTFIAYGLVLVAIAAVGLGAGRTRSRRSPSPGCSRCRSARSRRRPTRARASSTRPTPSTSTHASCRTPTARACSSSTRARRSTRSAGPARS